MIFIVIGVILFFTRIRLPADINSTLSAVGSMTVPASMIVTGMLFAIITMPAMVMLFQMI